jgi:hypothetical protein
VLEFAKNSHALPCQSGEKETFTNNNPALKIEDSGVAIFDPFDHAQAWLPFSIFGGSCNILLRIAINPPVCQL